MTRTLHVGGPLHGQHLHVYRTPPIVEYDGTPFGGPPATYVYRATAGCDEPVYMLLAPYNQLAFEADYHEERECPFSGSLRVAARVPMCELHESFLARFGFSAWEPFGMQWLDGSRRRWRAVMRDAQEAFTRIDPRLNCSVDPQCSRKHDVLNFKLGDVALTVYTDRRSRLNTEACQLLWFSRGMARICQMTSRSTQDHIWGEWQTNGNPDGTSLWLAALFSIAWQSTPSQLEIHNLRNASLGAITRIAQLVDSE